MTSLQKSREVQRTRCSSCGVRNRTPARFCGDCGQPLAAAPPADAPLANPAEGRVTAPTAPPPPPQPHDAPDTLPPKRRSPAWKKYGLIAVGVVAVAAVGFLLYPRPAFVVTSFGAPEAVVGGETLPISVGLANEGRAGGEQELTILIDGAPAQSQTVDVEAGAEETITFDIPDVAPGTYELAPADWEEQGRAVWVMTPPAFEIGSVAISPDPIDVNDSQEATVTANIANVGEADGTYLLRLEFDGDTVEERSIDLQGEASTEETFPIAVTEPGTHEVTAGDVTMSFEAYQLERPANGTVLTNEIGGGRNELRITNNHDEDEVIVLAQPGEGSPALLSVYVRGGSAHTVRGLRDGTYSIYYASGADWCTHNQAFTQNASYGRYEDDNTFTSDSTSYTWVALEIGITDGPGVPTDWISEEDFPTM